VPVLVVPGRVDAAFAALVTTGDAILARLSGRSGGASAVTVTLARKVVSTIGLVEIVPVQLQDSGAMPLASGYLPMQAMMKADGYIVVPADSEGFPAGSAVVMRAMP
jgi:molybdopterin biosynthesis enzyme